MRKTASSLSLPPVFFQIQGGSGLLHDILGCTIRPACFFEFAQSPANSCPLMKIPFPAGEGASLSSSPVNPTPACTHVFSPSSDIAGEGLGMRGPAWPGPFPQMMRERWSAKRQREQVLRRRSRIFIQQLKETNQAGRIGDRTE